VEIAAAMKDFLGANGREVVNNVASRDRVPSQCESEESAACRSEI